VKGANKAHEGKMSAKIVKKGFTIHPEALDPEAQSALVADLRRCLQQAPLFRPVMPNGTPMSVRLSAAGQFGWVSDRGGYRYQRAHPLGMAWPDVPESVLRVWDRFADCARQPECCLINWYDDTARMGLHQDRDEADFSCPVLSISLGDDALFRMGNPTRGGKTDTIWLRAGDVVVMGGEARLAYHGVDRIRPGSSLLLPKGGRINLTLRVVT
jgi:alkylated DNA repair protein (DNA oxidative demethylase)